MILSRHNKSKACATPRLSSSSGFSSSPSSLEESLNANTAWRQRSFRTSGGAEPISERRRSGDRQWRHQAGQPGHSDWARQLDVLRQRLRRQDGGSVAELHRDVQADTGTRSSRLVGSAMYSRELLRIRLTRSTSCSHTTGRPSPRLPGLISSKNSRGLTSYSQGRSPLSWPSICICLVDRTEVADVRRDSSWDESLFAEET